MPQLLLIVDHVCPVILHFESVSGKPMHAYTKTLEEALTEGVFDIPSYQRSYS